MAEQTKIDNASSPLATANGWTGKSCACGNILARGDIFGYANQLQKDWKYEPGSSEAICTSCLRRLGILW